MSNTVCRLLVLLLFSLQLGPFGPSAQCGRSSDQGDSHHQPAMAFQQSHANHANMAGCVATPSCIAGGPMVTQGAIQSWRSPPAHPIAFPPAALLTSAPPSPPVPPPIV